MNKVIFLGGIRGSGKTTLLREIKNIEKVKLVNLILKSKAKNWKRAQKSIGEQIKRLAFKNGRIIIDLHYAVPIESLKKRKKNWGFSHNFEASITKIMLKNMKDDKTLFFFCYLDTYIGTIKKRIRASKKRSPDFLKNINKIKQLDRINFMKIFREAAKLGLRVRKKIIYNNKTIDITTKEFKNIIWNQ